MILYNNIDQVKAKNRVVVLGNFDGVHLGHRELLKRAKIRALQLGYDLLVFTFYPQWQEDFLDDFGYIVTQEKKLKIFEECGADEVLSLEFNDDIAKVLAEDFVTNILNKLLLSKVIVVGYNYTFGYKGMGNVDLLKKLTNQLDIELCVVEPFMLDDEIISSSLIRQLLKNGEINKANKMLGYNLTLKGEVVYGRQIGRTMGIPTANIKVDDKIVLPKRGVYATRVFVEDEVHLGILNIGKRPTVHNGSDTSVEVHILDFNRDIYGVVIEVELLSFFRSESKFLGLTYLKEQINNDIEKLRKMFK